MKFFCTVLFLFVFEFVTSQVPGTLGFSYKSPLAQAFTLTVSSLDFTRANVTARILNNGVKPVTTSGILWGFSVPTISSYTGITTNGDITGTNNPCPSGFRLPTQQEFTNEISSLYVLNLTYGGRRYPNGASQQYAGDRGFYWTSSVVNGDKPVSLNIRNGVTTSIGNDFNGVGMSVSCIKD